MTNKRRRPTDEEYAALAADYEANPPRADEVISIEFGPAHKPKTAEPTTKHCTACGCPVSEHDDQGTCHALDLPGAANDCVCPGLTPPRGGVTMNDQELRELIDREARAAEDAPDEDDGQPLPAHVTVSRPNRPTLPRA